MRIIFDSEEEKEDFIDKIKSKIACPDKIGLPRGCKYEDCFKCWEKAIESEVKPQ